MDETERTNDNEHKILNKLPFEIVDVNEECLKNSCDPKGKYVHVGPKKYFLWEGYRTVGLQLYNFEARPDDVYLIGFPRSVYVYSITQYSDLQQEVILSQKGNNITEENILSKCTSEGNARYLQFHLPISLISPHVFEVGAKASWWCPYFEHVKEAWARRNEKNFLFIFYEDTIKDKQQTILKVGNLLGKELTKDQLKILEEHLDIENFRKNKRVNLDFLVESGDADGNYPFIGKGKPGTWREHFDVDLQKEADEWIEENLKDTDLRFPDC
ncbi:hypothetical protein NQ314_006172 [Rhamnusium bicolor]|uniref:Sulfotransferase domain-containing protein n=1 Tax=Rhamnusium bicolor TaxID=1586634 RepID=A0AAV8Z8K3_9CUCU|nr:hypothetical protein NQ314_006172 [Rhamnusium bicolor]